jgi:geranylgeranyl pyrophosphate synthase
LNYENSMSNGEQVFIGKVQQRIERALWKAPSGSMPSSSLEQAAHKLLLSPDAKRARAGLVGQVGKMVGAKEDALIDLAAAVELIHGASLLHDDVVDESGLRRGKPTANATRGNAFAVLCGDLVLSRAMQVLMPYGNELIDDAVEVVEEMTRAALVEIEDRGGLDVPLSRWRAMAEGKTGALFALCGKLPCRLVDDDDRAERLSTAFRSIGVAFQIVDDLNDLSGKDQTKPRGQDVREKNPSLPILLARAADRELAKAVDSAADVAAVCDRLLARARKPAIDVARGAVQDAVTVLGKDAGPLNGLISWTRSLVDEAA